MTTDLSIVPDRKLADRCRLSPDQLAARLDWIRREITPRARRRVALAGGVAWEFDASPQTRARLERLARLEAQCCGSEDLAFSVRAASDDALHFEIQGADAGGIALALESGSDVAPRPTRGRMARIVAMATVGSLLLCCILPIGVAAVAGAAIAAPLLRLDNPWAIGGVALAFGLGMWAWERRRSLLRATEPSEASATARPAAGNGAGSCGC